MTGTSTPFPPARCRTIYPACNSTQDMAYLQWGYYNIATGAVGINNTALYVNASSMYVLPPNPASRRRLGVGSLRRGRGRRGRVGAIGRA